MTTSVLQQLQSALEDGRAPEAWRWRVRRQLSVVRDTLLENPLDDAGAPDDGWLTARGGAVRRERDALLGRVGRLGPDVLEAPDLPRVRDELQRLVVDVSHHLQRRRDLAWDQVELELGGSD